MPRPDVSNSLLSNVIAAVMRIGRVPLIIILTWLLTVWWGEHATFSSHIQQCVWRNWEDWVSSIARELRPRTDSREEGHI